MPKIAEFKNFRHIMPNCGFELRRSSESKLVGSTCRVCLSPFQWKRETDCEFVAPSVMVVDAKLPPSDFRPHYGYQDEMGRVLEMPSDLKDSILATFNKHLDDFSGQFFIYANGIYKVDYRLCAFGKDMNIISLVPGTDYYASTAISYSVLFIRQRFTELVIRFSVEVEQRVLFWGPNFWKLVYADRVFGQTYNGIANLKPEYVTPSTATFPYPPELPLILTPLFPDHPPKIGWWPVGSRQWGGVVFQADQSVYDRSKLPTSVLLSEAV